jgi:hypothetical protein
MNVAAVMQAIADQLDTIPGLRCYGFPPAGAVSPPAAIVSYPDVDFDESYRRGLDKYELQVVVVVGEPTDQRSRDRLGAFCDGSGASSVKAVIEAGAYSAFSTIDVVRATPDLTVDNAGNVNLAYRFDLVITGSGS